MTKIINSTSISRRTLLKGTAATAGAAIGSGAGDRFSNHLGAKHQRRNTSPIRNRRV